MPTDRNRNRRHPDRTTLRRPPKPHQDQQPRLTGTTTLPHACASRNPQIAKAANPKENTPANRMARPVSASPIKANQTDRRANASPMATNPVATARHVGPKASFRHSPTKARESPRSAPARRQTRQQEERCPCGGPRQRKRSVTKHAQAAYRCPETRRKVRWQAGWKTNRQTCGQVRRETRREKMTVLRVRACAHLYAGTLNARGTLNSTFSTAVSTISTVTS